MKDGNMAMYRKQLIRRIGVDRVKQLEHLKHTTVKLSELDIKDLIAEYKRKIKEL